MWKKVFTEVEGQSFASRVVVQAELREGFAPRNQEADQYAVLERSDRIIDKIVCVQLAMLFVCSLYQDSKA